MCYLSSFFPFVVCCTPGNVDESSTNELVVAVEYTSTTDQSVHKVMLVSLTAQPDSNQPFLINGSHAINWVCGVCRACVRAIDLAHHHHHDDDGDGGGGEQGGTATRGRRTARARTSRR